MKYLDIIGEEIPGTMKVMLTCFVSNVRGLAFYQKLGFEEDEYSPPPKMLRNGTKIASNYVILSKKVSQ
jgi:RimJ/RimL family protein N-acetyltransferase